MIYRIYSLLPEITLTGAPSGVSYYLNASYSGKARGTPYHVIYPSDFPPHKLSLVTVLTLIHFPAHPLFTTAWKAG